jgi:antitoxin component YwqK of YwqJK toxin-antitoxin module
MLEVCKEYYENGDIRYIDNLKNGEKISRKAFDEEGKIKFEQKY